MAETFYILQSEMQKEMEWQRLISGYIKTFKVWNTSLPFAYYFENVEMSFNINIK